MGQARGRGSLVREGGAVNYTGKPYDVVTGLYDYGYRDYAPSLARFYNAVALPILSRPLDIFPFLC
jgi:RHS repeat-associated protein